MRGKQEQGKGKKMGYVQSRRNSFLGVSVFLSSPMNVMPEGEKGRRSIFAETNMIECMKYENSTNYLHFNLCHVCLFVVCGLFLVKKERNSS